MNNNNIINNNNNNDDKSDNMFEVPLDVDFLLVMLSMTVQGSAEDKIKSLYNICLLYTSPSPRDRTRSRMPSSA